MTNPPRRRPPWWPADEPFPPAAGDPRWRRMQHRFIRRMFILFLSLFMLICMGSAAVGWLVGNSLSASPAPLPFTRFSPLALVALIVVAVGLSIVGRSLRRIATPIGSLMDAADRVAKGDYSARVSETGPREVRSLAHAFNSMAARLEETDERRRNLLADVTHELRTPLTVIQGNLEGLLDDVYPRDEAHLASILEETRVLSRLIDDLRTLALAESGALKLQREPTDLGILLYEAVTSLKAQADAAGVTMRAESPDDLPLLDLDPARLREVVDNLIVNALHYTPRGGTITVRAEVEPGTPRQVAVSVADTGIGIPAQDLPHIFDRFFKSHDSRGSGLGLAIASNLISAHGGTVSATSTPGQGTTIRFTLPIPEP